MKKKRLNKTEDTNLSSKKTEIGLNDYEVGSWITKDVNELQNNSPLIFLIIQLY